MIIDTDAWVSFPTSNIGVDIIAFVFRLFLVSIERCRRRKSVGIHVGLTLVRNTGRYNPGVSDTIEFRQSRTREYRQCLPTTHRAQIAFTTAKVQFVGSSYISREYHSEKHAPTICTTCNTVGLI